MSWLPPPAEIEGAFALGLLATLKESHCGGPGGEKVGERPQARVRGCCQTPPGLPYRTRELM